MDNLKALEQFQRMEKVRQDYILSKDFHGFCYNILGYKDLNNIHQDLCSFLVDDGLFKLILMPRYTFKSSIATIGYCLFNLVREPNTRILIYSDASTKAEGFLTSIKAHIEGKVSGSVWRKEMGPWETDIKSGKWSGSQISIDLRDTTHPEPNVDTGGIETTKVGFHYDIIIFDDIVSNINVTTSAQMEKVYNCYRTALSLLVPLKGKVVIIGTRWNFGDMYGRLIAESEEGGGFKTLIIDGENDKKYGKYCFSSIGLTKDFIDQKRKDTGSYLTSCLYKNNPIDDETATFKSRDFSFYGDIKPDDLYITMTCDPAGQGEDYTAITVVGTDNKMDLHILEIINEHLLPDGIIDKLISLSIKYKIQMLGLETNFFRGMLKQELDRRIDIERADNPKFTLFGVKEFEASSRRGEGKNNRIMALQPYHERGALKFPGKRLELLEKEFKELSIQMLQFPHSAHDDILDALAYHLPLIAKGGVVKKADIPENTPAWLEREAYKKELERNRRLPKRARTYVEPLAFS